MNVFKSALSLCLFTACIWVIGASHGKHESSLKKSTHHQPAEAMRIVKRQASCLAGEYPTTGNPPCCKLCPAGTHKTADCTRAHESAACTPCKVGLEYTNVPNQEPKCHRCTHCDHGEAREIQRNCTAEQDTVCQCMERYFCDITSSCRHCKECTICESREMKACTRQEDTVCGEKSQSWTALIVVTSFVIVMLIAGVAAAYCWFKKKKGQRHDQSPKELELLKPLKSDNKPKDMDFPEKYPDVELDRYKMEIADELTQEQMLMFVRKNGMTEPTIQEIEKDNQGDTKEIKIQLFNKWYQGHGKSGAFDTLITILKDNKCREAARKIYEKISSSADHNNAVRSATEDVNNSEECNA